jgi:hypothetical protein
MICADPDRRLSAGAFGLRAEMQVVAKTSTDREIITVSWLVTSG